MNKTFEEMIDDIVNEKIKLKYENDELEAQGKLIKILCKKNKELRDEIKKLEKQITEYQDEIFGRDNRFYDMQD